MNPPTTTTHGKLISARKARVRLDLCPVTLWKLEKQGLLEGVTILSKKYYTTQSVERFEERAMTGSLSVAHAVQQQLRRPARWRRRRRDACKV
jgi:hypothetical protein